MTRHVNYKAWYSMAGRKTAINIWLNRKSIEKYWDMIIFSNKWTISYHFYDPIMTMFWYRIINPHWLIGILILNIGKTCFFGSEWGFLSLDGIISCCLWKHGVVPKIWRFRWIWLGRLWVAGDGSSGAWCWSIAMPSKIDQSIVFWSLLCLMGKPTSICLPSGKLT